MCPVQTPPPFLPVSLEEAAERMALINHSVDRYFFTNPLSYAGIELRNMASVACLIIESASRRKESRGLHYNIDYPETDDDNWRKDTILKRKGSGIWPDNMS